MRLPFWPSSPSSGGSSSGSSGSSCSSSALVGGGKSNRLAISALGAALVVTVALVVAGDSFHRRDRTSSLTTFRGEAEEADAASLLQAAPFAKAPAATTLSATTAKNVSLGAPTLGHEGSHTLPALPRVSAALLSARRVALARAQQVLLGVDVRLLVGVACGAVAICLLSWCCCMPSGRRRRRVERPGGPRPQAAPLMPPQRSTAPRPPRSSGVCC
mmetsp:Transcript_47767/g.127772  ORF Transcript_47767/g.127772 Transcript_47767/m.127772 type:complete len:216 (-) Transcript_47767:178-825(-)